MAQENGKNSSRIIQAGSKRQQHTTLVGGAWWYGRWVETGERKVNRLQNGHWTESQQNQTHSTKHQLAFGETEEVAVVGEDRGKGDQGSTCQLSKFSCTNHCAKPFFYASTEGAGVASFGTYLRTWRSSESDGQF
ncbi:unnamed protein product [Calypogeia fissa]